MSEFEKNQVNTSPAGDADVGTAEDVDAIMRKYDRESNVRTWVGLPKTILRWAMAAFTLAVIWMNLYASWDERVRRTMFLGVVILFVFALYPMKKGGAKRVNYIPWYDIVLALVGSFSYFNYMWDTGWGDKSIIDMGSRIGTFEFVLGIIGILVLVECCRRVVGIPILCVATVFVLYAYFAAGKTVKFIVYNLFYTTSGVIGNPVGVCATYIVLFVIFGAFLEATGVAAFFIDCANAVAGAATGGPAKVAVISSALCGMVSGSSVGNTVTTGSITIPLMKKTGYPGEFAGAVEAASSTGGQIMPPIMGAAAFLMAEMVGVPYSDIVTRAILPAALYFTGIFLMVHFKAKKMGLKGLPKETLPKLSEIIPRLYLILPLVILVAMIVGGKTMSKSAVYAILYTIVVSYMNREESAGRKLLMALPAVPLLILTFAETQILTAMGLPLADKTVFNICMIAYFALLIMNTFISKPNKEALPVIVDAMEGGTKNTLSVGVACGVAGIIAGVVTMTGLGQVFINTIVGIAGDTLIIALFLTMLCCIVLGMGVPTTANYIIMATTCAPILIAMDMPAMAAHFFVFYFGIVADITPPVALAAYAGSAIAKAPPMRTAFNATRLAIAAFIIPYIFSFNNALLFIDTTPFEIVQVVVTSFIGMFLISSGLMGYMLRDLNWLFRIVGIIGGLALIIPGTVTDLIGVGVLAVSLAYQLLLKGGKKATA
ncbi:MAG: TRAP transporter permease [Clostridium sp.]|nr:TRAP transporter permease [Clostridium sp.]